MKPQHRTETIDDRPDMGFRGKAYLSDLKLKNGIRRMLPEKPGQASLEQRRAQEIKTLVTEYWHRHHAVGTMPWTGREEKALADLIAMTRMCGLDFAQLISNRESSPGVYHRQRPSRWLRELPKFVRAPRKEA